MSDISLSKSVRSNLLSLQDTASMMGKTQERLATGNKVNSALDNPTNFFTAASLNSRSSDLSLLMDSVGNAVQTIAAADKGISAITKLVESAQSTARQALQTSATIDTVTTPAVLPSTGTAAVAATPVTGGAYTAGDVTASTISINGTAINTTEDMTQAAFITAINAQTTTTGVTASDADASGNITLTATTSGSANAAGNINITGTVTGTGLAVADKAGTAAVGPSAGTPAVVTTAANPKRDELLTQYNDLLTQISDLAKDSGFNGVNLINGDDLQVTFNEDGSSKLNVSGSDLDAAGLGLTALVAGDWSDNTKINTTLDKLKTGIEDLRTEASKFGSNLSVVQTRQDFTKNMINVLQTGAANLTLADTNEEAANLLALQTRQSIANSTLSMASQSDQAVLQLLR